MEKRMSATDARRHFGELMSLVAGGDTVVLEKSGEAVAAVIPIYWYGKWLERREADFAKFEESRSTIPAYPEHEVEADIAEAIAMVRAGWQPEHEVDDG